VLVRTKNILLVSHCFDSSDTVIYTKFVHSVFGMQSTIKTDTNLSCTIAYIPFSLAAVKLSRYLSKSIAVYFVCITLVCAKFCVGFGQLVCIQSAFIKLNQLICCLQYVSSSDIFICSVLIICKQLLLYICQFLVSLVFYARNLVK
jgi:hypothetical protein